MPCRDPPDPRPAGLRWAYCRVSGRRRRIPPPAVLFDLHAKSLKLRDRGLQRGDLLSGAGSEFLEAIQHAGVSVVSGPLVNWQDHDRRIGRAAVLPVADGRTTPDCARSRPGPLDAVDQRSRQAFDVLALAADRQTSYAGTTDHVHESKSRHWPLDHLASDWCSSLTMWPSAPAEHTEPRAWRTSRTDPHGRPPENMWWP